MYFDVFKIISEFRKKEEMGRIRFPEESSIKSSGLHVTKYECKRKLIKLSRKKLTIIDDPEIFLCKSVLINNMLKLCKNSRTESKVTIDWDEIFGDNEEENTTDKETDQQFKKNTLVGLSMPTIF